MSTPNSPTGNHSPNVSDAIACPQSAGPTDCAGPALTLHIDGQGVPIVPVDLVNAEFAERLRLQIEDANQPAVFQVEDFFAWTDESRYAFLRLLRAINGRGRLRLGTDSREFTDPFEAIVENLVGVGDMQRCIAGQRAAIEAAALFVTQDGWAMAATRIASSLRARGVQGVLPQSIRKQIATVAGQNADSGISATRAAREFHGSLCDECGLEAGEAALRYYQDDFYAWNGCRWEQLDDKEFEARVTRYLQADGRLKVTRKLVTDVIVNLKGQVILPNWHRSMPFWVESEQPLVIGTPRLMTFQNAMVDLDHARDNEMPQPYPIDSKFFSTVQLPYDYDPTADCPLWLNTIEQILPRRGDSDHRIEVLQEFMGLTLFARETRFESFLICVGKGANGKSTVLRTWEAMLGSDNVTHVPLDALGSEFRLDEMRGKLANIAADMQRLEKWEEGRLKELVSGEPIQVNRKHKVPLTMVPTARLIFATNELPPINDRSDGIWRRMIAMPFDVQFAAHQVDRRRAERLREELPGIFNWALRGAVRLFTQERFTACEVCNNVLEEHRLHSDPFRQFVDEEVVLGSHAAILTKDLYEAYKAFCERNGRKAKGSAEFGKQLQDLDGVRRERQPDGKRDYEYRGVSLRTRQHAPTFIVGRPTATRPTVAPFSNN